MTFRIPYLDKESWKAIRERKRTGGLIEITCPVCGEYLVEELDCSTKTPKIRPETLLKGYPCKCGTIYKAKFQDSHFHLFMEIPRGKLNL